MIQVNVHEAKTNLSKLLAEALKGEEVIIAKGNKPIVRLEVLPSAKEERRLGGAKGLVLKMSDDFFETLDDFEEYM